MTYTTFIKLYKDNFFSVISTKTNWGRLQLVNEFNKAMPDCESMDSFVTVLTTQFGNKISTKTSWGKNQVELLFTQAVANTTLALLDYINQGN